MDELKSELERKNKHFDFQFTEREYNYFMNNARLTKIEKQVLEYRRKEESIKYISYKLNISESYVNKLILKIKAKIIRCIIFG